MMFAGAMVVAMGVDTALGWPAHLYSVIGHPVTWLGRLIAALDARWNHDTATTARRRCAGTVAALSVIAAAILPAILIQCALPHGWIGAVLTGILAWPLVALRSMHDHVDAVAKPLAAHDLPTARHAVSMIVGRDPSTLDAAAVARAALESLAENTSDGIVAPLFWGAILGLPGIAAYKAINTLDSMIGHRTARHEAFGMVAARIDDVVNLIPARLTGLLFALASGAPRVALAVMMRDAGHHRSPNAGWPEAAMTGALGIRLSGPRIYAGLLTQEPWVNGACPDPTPGDLQRGLALYFRAMLGLAGGLLALALL
jgi:adenosylcobinamide-phosphate synthase